MSETSSETSRDSRSIAATPAAGYAGDVAPREAHRAVLADPDVRLIDVRTQAEWAFVGTPDLAESGRAAFAEWQTFPGGTPNPAFLDELARVAPPGSAVFFLCRSGGRSASAARAATAAGYAHAYNVADGFEGPHDGDGHRGTVAGWKAEGLPWRQG